MSPTSIGKGWGNSSKVDRPRAISKYFY